MRKESIRQLVEARHLVFTFILTLISSPVVAQMDFDCQGHYDYKIFDKHIEICEESNCENYDVVEWRDIYPSLGGIPMTGGAAKRSEILLDDGTLLILRMEKVSETEAAIYFKRQGRTTKCGMLR